MCRTKTGSDGYPGVTEANAPRANGYILEKCRFCGSIIHRQADIYGINAQHGKSDENGQNRDESSADMYGDGSITLEGGAIARASESAAIYGDGSIMLEGGATARANENAVAGRADGSIIYEGDAIARESGADIFDADNIADSHHDILGDIKVDKFERIKIAREYSKRISENGCSGICIRRDTCSCNGNNCKTCAVAKAGLCNKRYLINNDNSIALERDGGDYRNLMNVFIKRLASDGAYDKEIRRKLKLESARVNAYRDEVRRQLLDAADSDLKFEWSEYSLEDLLVMFPHIERRPVRIEIQLLIYLYYNYRYPIDLDHAVKRFQIPRLAINRYMRSYFGYTYSSLLSKIRNEHSKNMLRIPLLRVGEIGALVGYKSHYHYSLSFKRYEGLSPKEFREQA